MDSNNNNNNTTTIANNNNNNNNNNNYSIEIYNNKLYSLVFDNVYLRKLILSFLPQFYLFSKFKFYNSTSWDSFEYKDYLKEVTFSFQVSENLISSILMYDNIKKIKLTKLVLDKSTLEILNSKNIEKIFGHAKINTFNSTPSNNIYQLPDSLKSLNLNVDSNIKSMREHLPNELVKLEISGLVHKNNRLNFTEMKSLTELDIDAFGLNSLYVLDKISNCKSLTSLTIYINDIIVNNQMQKFNKLKYLDLNCIKFNGPLPTGLKTARLKVMNPSENIIVPESVEDFVAYSFGKHFKASAFGVLPVNIKTLKLKFNTLLFNDMPIIGPNVKSLSLCGFNQVLTSKMLPPNLEYLELDESFNQVIFPNVLPPTLKTLKLCDYSLQINPLSLPKCLINLHMTWFNRGAPPVYLCKTHPNLLVINDYDTIYNTSLTNIGTLKLPKKFDEPLSELFLKDKSKLVYLSLGDVFNHNILKDHLPINNNIKFLELSKEFRWTINLQDFPNLNVLNVPNGFGNSGITKTIILNPIISTTITKGEYDYFQLKKIGLPYFDERVYKCIPSHFHSFVKFGDVDLTEFLSHLFSNKSEITFKSNK